MLKQLKQLGGETMIYGVSSVVSRFIGVILVPLYTRLFTPADYGAMALVTTTMGLVSIASVLSLDNSAARWFWDTEDSTERKITFASWAWTQLAVSLLFGAIMYVAADPIARGLLNNPSTAAYFRLSAIALPLLGFGSYLTNWLRCRRKAVATVTYSVATTAVNAGLAVVLVVLFRQGLLGIFNAQVVAAALTCVVTIVMMRDWLNPVYFRRERVIEMLHFSLPLIPGSLAAWSLAVVDRYFVQFYSSATEVGLYQVGASIAAIAGMVVLSFNLAWGPFALSIHKEESARQVYANVFLAYTVLACLAATAMTVLAPEALRIMTTRSYYPAASVVGLLTLGWVFDGMYNIASIGVGILRQTKPVGYAVVGAAVINVGLNFALIPRWGKEGAAIATAVALGARAIYLFAVAQRRYPVPYRFAAASAVVAASAIVMIAGALLHIDNLCIAIGVKTLLVLALGPVVYALGIVDAAQLRRLFLRRAAGEAS